MAIAPVVTIRCMATPNTKKLQGKPREAFARTLRQWVDQRYDGNATKAAKALGVSQPHMSSMLSGDRGPGLPTLILLRAETGKSIDEMLGFASDPTTELETRLVASVQLEVGRMKKTIEDLRLQLAEREKPLKKAAP